MTQRASSFCGHAVTTVTSHMPRTHIHLRLRKFSQVDISGRYGSDLLSLPIACSCRCLAHQTRLLIASHSFQNVPSPRPFHDVLRHNWTSRGGISLFLLNCSSISCFSPDSSPLYYSEARNNREVDNTELPAIYPALSLPR